MISPTGWMVPTSLLASPIETSAVSGGIASGSARAALSTGAISTGRPSDWRRRRAASTRANNTCSKATKSKPVGQPRLLRAEAACSAPAVLGLVDELLQRALEVLQVQVQVEDLVDADRLTRRRRLHRVGRLDGLDLFDSAARDREHDNEGHLALRARDLELETLLLMAENLDVTALEAAPANGTVVKTSPIADELDDAHRQTHITPRVLTTT